MSIADFVKELRRIEAGYPHRFTIDADLAVDIIEAFEAQDSLRELQDNLYRLSHRAP